MFITTELTPNPHSLKFTTSDSDKLDKIEFSYSFKETEEAKKSHLAQKLFFIEGVESIFLSKGFVTITKKSDSDWGVLKPEILVTLMEILVSDIPIILENMENLGKLLEEESEIVKQIKELIEHRVRPAVAEDGGDIAFVDYKDGIVSLELHGSCSGCPSSTITLKNGIETMLKHYIPEIIAVESVN